MFKWSSRSIFVGIFLLASCGSEKSINYNLNILQDIKNLVPVVVIGSGPAGYAAALYSGRGGNYTLVIEGENPGGQLMQTSYIENWPGVAKTDGPKVMEICKKQVAEWGVKFLQENVTKVDFGSWPFKITTSDKKEIYALSVVVATGATSRKLGISGEAQYWGTGGVSGCAVCDAPMYKNKDVIIVGGGDSAIEQVFQLSPYVRSIKLFVRKDQMRASKAMQEKLKDYKKATVYYNRELTKIVGDNEVLSAVEYIDNKTGQVGTEKISGVFLAVGHDPATEIFKGQLELENGFVRTFDRGPSTSVKGVYVAGEAEDHVFMQAGTAAGDGIKAGMNANFFLRDIGFSPEVAKSLENNFYNPNKSAPRAMREVEEIKTQKEFIEKVENSKETVIVDFYSTHCQPCKAMLPRLQEVASEVPDRKFYKVNVDELSKLVDKYYILMVPCFIIFDKGNMIIKYQGMLSKDELLDLAKEFKTPIKQS